MTARSQMGRKSRRASVSGGDRPSETAADEDAPGRSTADTVDASAVGAPATLPDPLAAVEDIARKGAAPHGLDARAQSALLREAFAPRDRTPETEPASTPHRAPEIEPAPASQQEPEPEPV